MQQTKGSDFRYTLVLVAAQHTPIRHLSLHSLLPETQQYMTYEGSTTHPGCWETTVWIILNRPIYITKQEVTTIFAYPSSVQTLLCILISYCPLIPYGKKKYSRMNKYPLALSLLTTCLFPTVE
jgi:hypothetical protein